MSLLAGKTGKVLPVLFYPSEMTDDEIIGWIGIMVVWIFEMEVPAVTCDDASSYIHKIRLLLVNYITLPS